MRNISAIVLIWFILQSPCMGQEQQRPVAVPNDKSDWVSTEGNTEKIDRLLQSIHTYPYPDGIQERFYQALTLSRAQDYPEGEAGACLHLATFYNSRNRDSFNLYTSKLDGILNRVPSPMYNQLLYKDLMARKYCNIAASHYEKVNYSLASASYLKVIALSRSLSGTNYRSRAWAYMGLGAISSRLSNMDRAIAYFEEASALAQKFDDSTLLLKVKTSMATLMMDNKQYSRARAVALDALALDKGGNDDSRLRLANTIAICLIEENQPEQAMQYSNMVLEIAARSPTLNGQVTAYYILGYNYVALRQFNKAKKYLIEGLALAERHHVIDNISNGYGQLAMAYEGLGQFEEALAYQRKYVSLRDSLLGHENAAKFTEIETRYRVAQKDKLLTEKNKSLLLKELKIASQQKRLYLWIGGSIISILLLLVLLNHKRNRVKLTRLKATLAGEEKERRRLAQELHDGIVSRLSIIKMNFSALSLQYQGRQDAPELNDVVEQLEQSIRELRTTSHNLLPDVLQQAGLAESVRLYCEKIKSVSPLQVDFQLLGALPPLSDDFQLNVYRILQELINNILKHSNAVNALIQFQVREDFLSITIDDDSSPDLPGAGTQGDNMGIGLRNLQDRIYFLQGSMDIERGKGTSVYLEFNLKKFIKKK